MTTHPAPGAPGWTALYRYYDADGFLLYVGITGDLSRRETSHIRASEWTQLVVGSTVERYPTRKEAARAEDAAIRAEHPLFNVEGNDTAAARKRLRTYLEDRDLADIMGPWRRKEPSRIRIVQAPAEPDEPIGDVCGCGHETHAIRIDSDGREHIPVILEVVGSVSDDLLAHVQVYLHYQEARALGEALIRHADQPTTDYGERMVTAFAERDCRWYEVAG